MPEQPSQEQSSREQLVPLQEQLLPVRSPREAYCLEMLRWAILSLREAKCKTVPEYELRLNALGYLGNCFIAEGGTREELHSMDTEKWFFTEPGQGL